MNAEQQTKEALLASSALVSLVDHRITPDEIEEDAPLPAISFERGATEPQYTLETVLSASRVAMTITVWALSRSSANQVADAITTAMHTAGHAQTSREAVFEPELDQYAAVMAFDVWEL